MSPTGKLSGRSLAGAVCWGSLTTVDMDPGDLRGCGTVLNLDNDSDNTIVILLL